MPGFPSWQRKRKGRSNSDPGPNKLALRSRLFDIWRQLPTTLPGYNYVGLQGLRYNGEFVNELDELAYLHDRMYESLQEQYVNVYFHYNSADAWLASQVAELLATRPMYEDDVKKVENFLRLKRSVAVTTDFRSPPTEIEINRYLTEYEDVYVQRGLDDEKHDDANGICDDPNPLARPQVENVFGHVDDVVMQGPVHGIGQTFILWANADLHHFGRRFRLATKNKSFGKFFSDPKSNGFNR